MPLTWQKCGDCGRLLSMAEEMAESLKGCTSEKTGKTYLNIRV